MRYVRITPHEPRICPECGTTFVPARCDAIVCSPNCRKLRYRRVHAMRSVPQIDEELRAVEVALVKALAD
jgi:hypothetical protein